ncbi:hypothetical protein BCR44DRAFT_204620 [Catenaria anguillulae PL171]|uniref:Uncharacterized protein n=1 Tax=Catenaria anguillulae PL171 TaxID=765915 RepID=A0A1Y2HJ92_9FUNG|nr:hypothetical protein BCR44DRAFT_204620 [Catenaria anguillulae PL171]
MLGCLKMQVILLSFLSRLRTRFSFLTLAVVLVAIPTFQSERGLTCARRWLSMAMKCIIVRTRNTTGSASTEASLN